MTEEDSNKKKEAAVDLAGILGMGGILEGVTNILGKLSDLAEKGQQLQAAQGEKPLGKQMTGSYGFSVKFAGAGKGDDLNVEPLKTPNRTTAVKPAGSPTRLREPHVEVFDEGDHVLVVAEMPGVTSEDVQLEFVEKNLSICGQSKAAEFKKTIELPSCFGPEHVAISANNGVVEIRLRKD